MRYKVLFSFKSRDRASPVLQPVVSLQVHGKIRKLGDLQFFQYGLAFSGIFLMQRVTSPTPQKFVKSYNKRQWIWNLHFSQSPRTTPSTPLLSMQRQWPGYICWESVCLGVCCLLISPLLISGEKLPLTLARMGRCARMCAVLNSVIATVLGTQASKSQSYPKPSKEMGKARLWARGGHIKTVILRHSPIPCWGVISLFICLTDTQSLRGAQEPS